MLFVYSNRHAAEIANYFLNCHKSLIVLPKYSRRVCSNSFCVSATVGLVGLARTRAPARCVTTVSGCRKRLLYVDLRSTEIQRRHFRIWATQTRRVVCAADGDIPGAIPAQATPQGRQLSLRPGAISTRSAARFAGECTRSIPRQAWRRNLRNDYLLDDHRPSTDKRRCVASRQLRRMNHLRDSARPMPCMGRDKRLVCCKFVVRPAAPPRPITISPRTPWSLMRFIAHFLISQAVLHNNLINGFFSTLQVCCALAMSFMASSDCSLEFFVGC